jgi:hypothetical protein
MRVEVVPDTLRAAAGAVQEARVAVESLSVRRPLDAAAAAVPGGRLAAAALTVGERWSTQRALVAAELARYARALAQSAATYDAVEATAVGRVGGR